MVGRSNIFSMDWFGDIFFSNVKIQFAAVLYSTGSALRFSKETN